MVFIDAGRYVNSKMRNCMTFSSVISGKLTNTLYSRSDLLEVACSKKLLESNPLTTLKFDQESLLLHWSNTCLKTDRIIETTKECIEFGWWIEIFTIQPISLYYFGLFEQRSDALLAQDGYVEDLRAEGAEIIAIQIKRCQPRQLTMSQFDLKPSDFRFLSSLIADQ